MITSKQCKTYLPECEVMRTSPEISIQRATAIIGRLAAHLISLLSGLGFPVLPKLFPVSFRREYRKNPASMLH
jgi:hypothetical protein